MIEMRWVKYWTPVNATPSMRAELQTKLQFREWPPGMDPKGDTEPIWIDVPTVMQP